MFNVGKTAKDFSALSDSDLLASAMATIKKWYPSAPNYVSYKRSSWGNDPYSLGSYPFVKAGASTNDCALYREADSTGKKVYFAGDGTTCLMIGTVHGAYITGVDAVKNILGVSTSSGMNSITFKIITAMISLAAIFFF
jgi:monoamine oxidase